MVQEVLKIFKKTYYSGFKMQFRDYQELADGSIGSLDRNDKQTVYSHLVYHSHSHIHITHFERRKSRCIATVDICSTSFQTCGHDVIAAFDVLHLLAHHRGSVAFSLPRSQPFLS